MEIGNEKTGNGNDDGYEEEEVTLMYRDGKPGGKSMGNGKMVRKWNSKVGTTTQVGDL